MQYINSIPCRGNISLPWLLPTLAFSLAIIWNRAKTWSNDLGRTQTLGGSKRLTWQFMKRGGSKPSPTANTNTALCLRVWGEPSCQVSACIFFRRPGPEQVRKITVFIKKQTVWLSLRMAKVSVTAGNCNTCGLFKREDRSIFINWERKCLRETSFIWNMRAKQKRWAVYKEMSEGSGDRLPGFNLGPSISLCKTWQILWFLCLSSPNQQNENNNHSIQSHRIVLAINKLKFFNTVWHMVMPQ